MARIRVSARLSPAEWCALIAAAAFYGLRQLPEALDMLSVAVGICIAVAVISQGIARKQRRAHAVIAGVILCGILIGAVASARVRSHEAGPEFGIEQVQRTGEAPTVQLALRAEDDARRAPTGEFQVWARVYWICRQDVCASANARAFVRDSRLPPLLAGTPFHVSGSLRSGEDVVFVRIDRRNESIAVADHTDSAGLSGFHRTARTVLTRAFRSRISHWPLETRGVFAALFAGDRIDLPHRTERLMRDAGAAHILALSGMHLGILAGSVFLLSKRLMSPPVARVTACVFALVYLGFAGLRPSLVRAVVMLCIGTAVRARDGIVHLRIVLALSFLVHSLLLPKDLTSLAFGLSFLSLSGLVLLAAGVHALLPAWLPKTFRAGIAAGLAAQTSTAPLVFSVFGVMHPAGILVSVLLTPIAVLVIALGGLAFLSGPFSGPWLAALSVVTGVLEQIARAGGRVPSLASAGGMVGFLCVVPLLLVIARVRYRWQLRRWRRDEHEQRLFRFNG